MPADAAAAAMTDPVDGFVARWSRRKRGEDAPEDGPAPLEAESREPAAEPSEDEIVAQLPDIDSMDESADFTVFLKKGVPEELRKRALRRLWRLNPVFANLDGLNDYDEDFNTVTTLLDGLKTVYQVGKGMPGPSEPDERATQTDGRETSEQIDEKSENEPRAIAQTPAVPVADSNEEAVLPEDVEPAVAEQQDEAVGKASGRSAAERRWGRLER